VNDIEAWLQFDGPMPEPIRALLDALRDPPPETPGPGADVLVDRRWIASTSPVAIFLPKRPHQVTAKAGENIQTRSQR
jgi:hypothetical protein